MTAEPVLIGIDVAKDKLDIARSDTEKVITVANDHGGITKRARMLDNIQPTLTVIEAARPTSRRN